MIALLREHRELRQFRQSDVHAEGRAFALPAVHAAVNVGVDRAFRHEPIEQQLGIDAGDDGLGAPRLAAGNDAGRPALVDDDLLDRRAEQDVDALLSCGAGHRLRDRAHAADGVAPGARDASRFAEQMVQQHVGTAGRVRARRNCRRRRRTRTEP